MQPVSVAQTSNTTTLQSFSPSFHQPPPIQFPSTTLPAHAPHPTTLLRNINPLRRPLLRLRRINNPLLDIRREAIKRLLHINIALGRDFHEGDAELVGELLAALDADDAFFLPVAFVADEDFIDAFRGVLFDVGEPGSDVCGGRGVVNGCSLGGWVVGDGEGEAYC